MKNIILLLSLLLSSATIAQNDRGFVNEQIAEFTTSLKNRNIDSILVTTRYCRGKVEMFRLYDGSLCSSKSTYYAAYLFWMEESKPMIKKIDNCGMFYSLELSDNKILEFLAMHGEEINQYPIKPYEMAAKESGPVLSTQIHSCSRTLDYQSGKEYLIEQIFNLFDLTNDALEANLNYEYNKNSKAFELNNMLDLVVGQMDDKFRRLQ